MLQVVPACNAEIVGQVPFPGIDGLSVACKPAETWRVLPGAHLYLWGLFRAQMGQSYVDQAASWIGFLAQVERASSLWKLAPRLLEGRAAACLFCSAQHSRNPPVLCLPYHASHVSRKPPLDCRESVTIAAGAPHTQTSHTTLPPRRAPPQLAGRDPLAQQPGCRYKKIADLNNGTNAFVQLAEDVHTQQLVAIKFLARGKKLIKDADREICNLRLCSMHPYIIRFKEVSSPTQSAPPDWQQPSSSTACTVQGPAPRFLLPKRASSCSRPLCPASSAWHCCAVIPTLPS